MSGFFPARFGAKSDDEEIRRLVKLFLTGILAPGGDRGSAV